MFEAFYAGCEVFTAVNMTMSLSGMWRSVALVRGDVSEERVAFIFKIEEIRERGTGLAIG
jgi:hypothetical protein